MSCFFVRAATLALFVGLSLSCGARSELGESEPPDTGCRPIPCAPPDHWDAPSCACVPARCPNDSGEFTIATISTEFAEGTAVVVHDGEVYWTTRAGKDDSEGVVSKVSRCGGAPTTLASGLQGPAALATDGAHVFFGTIGGGTVMGALQIVPASGGAVDTIATGAIYSGRITTDGADVYWTGAVGSSFGAFKAPVSGGKTMRFTPDQIFADVLVDATRAYLSQPASIPSNSKLLSTPLGGGPLEVLVDSNLDYPGLIAIDDDDIYFISGDSNLSRMPKGGGVTTQLSHAEINAFVVDDASVYWAQGDATTGFPDGIERVPKAGGGVTEISPSYGAAIAVDESYVYWLKGGDLIRARK